MDLALIVLIVVAFVGIISFGIANVVNYLAKFIFFLIIILLLVALFYGYFLVYPPLKTPVPPTSNPPVEVPSHLPK